MELIEGGGAGDALGEDADGGFICADCAGGGVATDDVVVEDGLKIPALGFGELGEVTAAVEALLFAGYGEEDDGAGKLELAEDPGGLEGDGGAAGVVVGTGGGVVGVEVIGVAGVVVTGDENHAVGLDWVCAAENGVDVGEFCWLGDAGGRAGGGWLDELVAFDFKAATAGFGVTLEFGLDPVGGGIDAGAGGKVGFHAGESAAIVEADELCDDGFDVIGRDLLKRAGDGGVDWGDRNGLADGSRLLRVKKSDGQEGNDNGKAAEMREEAGDDGHEKSPYVETKMLLQSYA